MISILDMVIKDPVSDFKELTAYEGVGDGEYYNAILINFHSSQCVV